VSETVVRHAIERIEQDGYCVLPRVLSGDQVARALALADAHWERTRGRVGKELPAMAGGTVVWNLQNKDGFFLDLLLRVEPLERILVHFLNDPWYRRIPPGRPNYILRAYVARSASAALPLHIDSFIPYQGRHLLSMQCSLVLDDMTTENGCTVVVPGSHQRGEWAEPSALCDAVPIEARAGDAILWDSRLWHGALANRSGASRWLLIATFTRWWIKQAFEVTRALPDAVYQELGDDERAVLGFCSIPHTDEFEGVVTQRGHDALPKSLPRGEPSTERRGGHA
jgi:ectoine hydroxylase-related dioxygenase (phytanoyl-CoA dioxygenase family)